MSKKSTINEKNVCATKSQIERRVMILAKHMRNGRSWQGIRQEFVPKWGIKYTQLCRYKKRAEEYLKSHYTDDYKLEVGKELATLTKLANRMERELNAEETTEKVVKMGNVSGEDQNRQGLKIRQEKTVKKQRGRVGIWTNLLKVREQIQKLKGLYRPDLFDAAAGQFDVIEVSIGENIVEDTDNVDSSDTGGGCGD